MWNLFKKHPREITFTLLLAFFGGFAQTYLLSFFNEGLVRDLNLSNETISFAYSCATFFASLLLPVFGKFIDVKPVRFMSLVIGFALMLSFLLFANVFNLITLFLSYFLMRGLGQVAITLVATTYISKNFGNNRGKALSLSSLGRAVSHGILPIIITFIIVKFGWRFGAYFFVVTLLFIYLPLVYFYFGKFNETILFPENENVEVGLKNKSVGEIFKSHFIYLLSIANTVIPFLMTGIFFQQGYFREHNNWSLSLWGGAFLAFASAQIVLSFVCGFIIDKFSARRLLPFVLLPFLLAVFVMDYFHGDIVCYIFMALSGASVGLSANARAAFMGECFNNKNLGFIKSIDSTLMVISTSIAPLFFSYIYRIFNYSGLLTVNYIVLIIGIISFTYCSVVIKKNK